MDINDIIKVFSSQKTQEKEQTPNIPQEVLNQYPYGQFPIQYTRTGQEQLRKQSENRFSKNEESTKEINNETNQLDIMSLLPIISMLQNKKQPKDMFELLSNLLFKDKPEMKNLFNLIPKHKNQEINKIESFPNTNKVSINSLKRIND